MTSVLSDSDAATRIVSVWKGFHVRKIFSAIENIHSWAEYDDISSKTPTQANFLSAWEAALQKLSRRLCEQDALCRCFCGYDDCEDDRSDPGDWMWNDGGGYNDW